MKKIKKILSNALLLGFAIVYLSPLYLVFVNSMKDRAEMNMNVLALPKQINFEYYIQAMEKMKFLRAFVNSLKMTVFSIIIITITTAMCSWMIARTKTKTSKVIYYSMIAMMLVPFQSIMMPLMSLMGWIERTIGLNMVNSNMGLIFMYWGFGIGFNVFLYHGFVNSIPIAIEEAATIDGCNKWQMFWQVIFPMLKPITITTIILNVLWIWNDYLLPSLTLSDVGLRTLPLSTFYFFGTYSVQWNQAMAALVLTMIPVLIFYALCQKYIVKGVAAGAIK